MKKITVVGAVIQDEQSRILCALRSPNMVLPNVWEFPGGKVEDNENFEQALTREIREELNIEIYVHEKITEVTHQYEAVEVNLHTYWCSISSGVPKANEHQELMWIPKEKLENLEWAPADIPTVDLIR